MCGIAGVLNWSGEAVDVALLKNMTDLLRHRGPDGEGHHRFGNAGLGHRRLSIIDVDAGRQPMSNEAGSVWVTFNGEIYNFRELRRELESLGHQFSSHSDTEVIVHGYEQWGADVVTRLRGMFAFGVLDQPGGKLFLARDRFGIKPLVYFEGAEQFMFASEIKAIVASPAVPRVLNVEALADYFECGYIPAPRTIYRDIFKLLPGHCLTLDIRVRGPVRQERYWCMDFSPAATVSEEEAIHEINRLLTESVRSELVSDVPLGAFLSGGIDSSSIVSVMAQVSPEPVKTFSIGFENERFSEVEYARAVARAHGTDHHEYIVRADIADLLPRLVYHFDEPFSDASAVPTYYLCEMARRNVTVCLSGDGGDELFAGYDRYQRCLELGRLDGVPRWMRRAFSGALRGVYPRSWPGARYVAGVGSTVENRFIDYLRDQYGSVPLQEILGESLRAELPRGRRDFEMLRGAFGQGTNDDLHRYLEVDVNTYLPNDILAKVDITSMMNSLEVRVPLLDHKLAEYVARLPSGFKMRNGVGKYILKKAMHGRLSNEVLYRKKMGFGVPMREWVATRLRDVVRSYLLDSARVSGLLEPRLLQRLVDDNERNLYRSRVAGKLWWVLFFEMWYQDTFSSPPRRDLAAEGLHKPHVSPTPGSLG